MKTQTLARRVSRIDYRPSKPVVLAGRLLGMKAVSAHQLCYGRANVFRRAALIVRAFVESGEAHRVDRLIAPILEARNGRPLALSTELIHRAQRNDLHEDERENDYRLNPCRETALAWVRAMEVQLSDDLSMLASLKKAYGL